MDFVFFILFLGNAKTGKRHLQFPKAMASSWGALEACMGTGPGGGSGVLETVRGAPAPHSGTCAPCPSRLMAKWPHPATALPPSHREGMRHSYGHCPPPHSPSMLLSPCSGFPGPQCPNVSSQTPVGIPMLGFDSPSPGLGKDTKKK